jgi:hypothetical protein
MTTQPGQKSFSLVNGGKAYRVPLDSGGALIGSMRGHGGTVVLNGATPVPVVSDGVTADSIIILTLKTVGGTVSPTAPNVLTITPGTGFSVAGVAGDTSTYNWARLG